MLYNVPHYIGGESVLGKGAANHTVYNPALGKAIGTVVFADAMIIELAVSTAKNSFITWSKSTAIKRARILFKFREILEHHIEELACLVSSEHGKTLEDARGSIARGIELVEYHCNILSQLQGGFSSNVASSVDCHTILEPLGVCVGVSPFNFPVMVPLWMIIPAIACGNTFILKPSEQNPSAPLRILQWLEEAGLPKGVVNCVQGNKATVEQLISHIDVKTCTAVASTPVAEAIYQQATALGKRAHTFGSAKNHAVVMPDADLNTATDAIIGAAYGSAGERCMAIAVVVLVGKDLAAAWQKMIIPKIQAICIGVGDDPSVDMGPLVSATHRQKVLDCIEQGIVEGASLIVDGRDFKHPKNPEGYFLGPCLFTNVDENMSIYQAEIFGPVLVTLQVADLEEALQLINRNPYGNGSAIFTKDGFTAREFSTRVQVGMVGINVPIPVPIASHPFGGWKRSSFGDTNMHGLESIHFYTQQKTITSKWPETELSHLSFNMPSHH